MASKEQTIKVASDQGPLGFILLKCLSFTVSLHHNKAILTARKSIKERNKL